MELSVGMVVDYAQTLLTAESWRLALPQDERINGWPAGPGVRPKANLAGIKQWTVLSKNGNLCGA